MSNIYIMLLFDKLFKNEIFKIYGKFWKRFKKFQKICKAFRNL